MQQTEGKLTNVKTHIGPEMNKYEDVNNDIMVDRAFFMLTGQTKGYAIAIKDAVKIL